MESKTFICKKCDSVFTTKSNLTRHEKNVCNVQLPTTQNVDTNTNTSMMMLMLKQIEDLQNKLKSLEEENELLKTQQTEQKEIHIMEKPILKTDLYDLIFEVNPYLKKMSCYSNGYTPKSNKQKFVLKSIDENDYPTDCVMFYKKCFTSVLKSIPTEKLPYRVCDKIRHIYHVYDYENNSWIKGGTDELIKHTITVIAMMIHSSMNVAVCNLNINCDFMMYKALYNVKNNFNKIKISEIQVMLTYKFGLPNYEDSCSEKDVMNFYKRNFVKNCFHKRFEESDNDDDVEEEDDDDVAENVADNVEENKSQSDDDEAQSDDECDD